MCRIESGAAPRALVVFASPAVIAVIAALAAVACKTTTYCVRRSALVPVPAPNMRPAREPAGHVEANFGQEVLAWLKPPARLAGRNVGLYVPRAQFNGQLLFAPHKKLTLGFSYELGLADGAVPVARGLIDRPSRTIGGAGLHFGVHHRVKRWITLSWSCDLWGYSIASRVAYRDASTGPCDDPNDDPRTWSQKLTTSTLFVGRTQLSVGMNFRWTNVTVGTGLRSHPHNVDASVEEHLSPAGIRPRLSQAVYPYVFLNWEFRLAKVAYLGLTLYQPLNIDPVLYAPIVGINLRLTHVRDEPPPLLPPGPPPGPPPPPPPG